MAHTNTLCKLRGTVLRQLETICSVANYEKSVEGMRTSAGRMSHRCRMCSRLFLFLAVKDGERFSVTSWLQIPAALILMVTVTVTR